jgi:hypothetical protein
MRIVDGKLKQHSMNLNSQHKVMVFPLLYLPRDTLKNMFGASIAVISSRIRKHSLMALASWIPPVITLNNSRNHSIHSKYTFFLQITKLRNPLFRVHAKELFIHGRFGSPTNYRVKGLHINPMQSNTNKNKLLKQFIK